jgi:hypothetical protein
MYFVSSFAALPAAYTILKHVTLCKLRNLGSYMSIHEYLARGRHYQ